MALAGLIGGLSQSVGQYGTGVKQTTEGQGSYNPYTGEFYDPKKVERTTTIGAMLSPTDVLRSKNYTGGEKALIALTGGAAAGLFSKKYRERLEAKNAKTAAQYEELQQKVTDLPGYEIPPEAQEKLALMQEASADISGVGQEMTELANKRAGRPEMREAQMVREDIKQNSAARLQAIQESGSEDTLSSIAKAGGIEQEELRNLNRKQTAYRFQAESDLMNAKINQASMEAAGAQLEGEGLSGIIREKGKVYQSELDKQLTGINLDISRYSGGQMQQLQAQQNRATNNAAFTNGVANTALSYINNRSMMKDSGQGQ